MSVIETDEDPEKRVKNTFAPLCLYAIARPPADEQLRSRSEVGMITQKLTFGVGVLLCLFGFGCLPAFVLGLECLVLAVLLRQTVRWLQRNAMVRPFHVPRLLSDIV
jgi:hypothetical protein